jgi:hypothetical protein
MTGVFLTGIIGLLVGAAVGMGCMIVARKPPWTRRPRRLTACPMCSGPLDRFIPTAEGSSVADGPSQDSVICTNVISEVPCFEECDFSFPRWMLDVPWLTVGGVGTPSAGQTVWNTAYLGSLDPFCTTETVEAEAIESKATHEFRRNWEDFAVARFFPAATQTNWHAPSLALLRRQRRRTDRLVLAITDAAGEIPRSFTMQDWRYRQLLRHNAHIFFIDLRGDPIVGQPLEKEQLGVFHRFLVNLRKDRGLADSDSPIGPIAVCISKCDMLSLFCQGKEAQAVRFIEQLRDSGPTNSAATLRSIMTRSELVERNADILPCVGSLAQRLRSECGPNGFMFFPMTAVGWADEDVPDRDLRNRTIAPWGVIDPVLWLVHASGFRALPE